MKRASTMDLLMPAGGSVLLDKADLPAQLVSNMRWIYRMLINAGPDYAQGFMPGDFVWMRIGREPPAGGALGGAIALPQSVDQFELPVHDASIPDLCFGSNIGSDCKISVTIEWDDGSPSPKYMRGQP